jgi:hypothetical protein
LGAEAVAKGRGASRRVKEVAEGREETYRWVLQTVFFAQEELDGLVDTLEGKRNNRDGSQRCKRPQLVLLLMVREEEFPVWEFGQRFLNLVSFNPRSVLRGMESYPTEVHRKKFAGEGELGEGSR